MRVYFVRHGQTDWNVALRIQGHTDIPLNANGEKKAYELAARLAQNRDKYPIDALYCSYLQRARRTADIIGQAIGVKARVADDLEEINMGSYEGLTWKEVEERFADRYELWNENRFTMPPVGSNESYEDVFFRVKGAMDTLVRQADPAVRSIAIVTHGGVLRPILVNLTGADKAHMEDLEIPNLALLATDYDPQTGAWTYAGTER